MSYVTGASSLVPILSRCRFTSLRSVPLRRFSILDQNAKITKDVLLFKYENPKFFRMLNIFGLVQFGIMVYTGHFVFTTLKDTRQAGDPNDPRWWNRINLGDPKYKKKFAGIFIILGWLMLSSSWMFTLRSVRLLVLRKGGENISLVTYTPFGQNRLITVPLDKMCSKESRTNAKVYLPIKVKGHVFHYMLDMKGEFVKKDLFDITAGLHRTIN